jgi:hypothetical protein
MVTDSNIDALFEKIKSHVERLHGIDSGSGSGSGSQDGENIEYALTINQNNSGPDSIITVDDPDENLPAAKSDNWMTLLGLKPCILRNGTVVSYLDINDYTKDTEGNTVDLSVLGDDVMLEIPRMGYKVEETSNEVFKITISNDITDESLDFSAFSLDDWGDCDKLYYGVYKGYVDNNALYSSYDKTPSGTHTLANFREYAKSRGTGYIDVSYAADEMLQLLYCLTVQNTNGQSAIGLGHIYAGNAQSNVKKTGGSEAYGPFMQLASSTARTTNKGYHSKCLGIEDFWGNISQFEDGLIKTALSGSQVVLRAKCASDFNSTGEGYVNVGTLTNVSSTHDMGHVKKMSMQQGCLFIPILGGGSNSTYYADYSYWGTGTVFTGFGGHCNNNLFAGPFYRYTDVELSRSEWKACSRLMYLHKED